MTASVMPPAASDARVDPLWPGSRAYGGVDKGGLEQAEARDDYALAKLLSEDLDAGFAELIRAYERMMYTLALRVCGVPADAEDIAAEAFLKAYSALRGYNRERLIELRLRPWLVTIQLNVWRNWVRSRARRPTAAFPGKAGAAEGTELELAAPGASIEEQVELAETSRELVGLLNQLPTTQRTAIVLRHVIELPVAEIAEILGCPPGTVKSHVSRGLKRLRSLSGLDESEAS
jgi:RNA polymerase sigma factor (sigma-70 family)